MSKIHKEHKLKKQTEDYGKGKFLEYAFNLNLLTTTDNKKINVSTNVVDWTEHWDSEFNYQGSFVKVDVKGKKLKSYDSVILEFVSNKGEIGWMLGHAEFIAFEQEDYFYFVHRKTLLEYCLMRYVDVSETKIEQYLNGENLDELVKIFNVKNGLKHENDKTGQYQDFKVRYQRSGNDDVTIRLETSEVIALKEKTLLNKIHVIPCRASTVKIGDIVYYEDNYVGYSALITKTRNPIIGHIAINSEDKEVRIKEIKCKIVDNNS